MPRVRNRQAASGQETGRKHKPVTKPVRKRAAAEQPAAHAAKLAPKCRQARTAKKPVAQTRGAEACRQQGRRRARPLAEKACSPKSKAETLAAIARQGRCQARSRRKPPKAPVKTGAQAAPAVVKPSAGKKSPRGCRRKRTEKCARRGKGARQERQRWNCARWS